MYAPVPAWEQGDVVGRTIEGWVRRLRCVCIGDSGHECKEGERV